MPKEYYIGHHCLALPDDHKLDQYQSTWLRYDTALGDIARIVFQQYPTASAIDIGANVGDSAALIQKFQAVPTLCIEGNPEFLEYLDYNAASIGNIEIEACFIGTDGDRVNFDQINSQRGTASIVDAVNAEGTISIEMRSLKTVLERNPAFQTARLLKIDTDGFDFWIIQSSIEVIRALQPVLYFEYDISFKPEGRTEALGAIKTLFDCGYEKFIVYDNFGNYLLSVSAPDYEVFVDLNAYLFSNRFKNGAPTVFYLDICAFTQTNTDVFEQIRAMEREG